ncbi:hypothetical protein KCV06_g626, partial [Aureobasidium melanogenum]
LDSNINCPLSLREVLSARLIKKGQTVTVLPDAKRAKETVSVEAERPKTPRRTPREARRSQQTTRVESDRSNSTFPAGVRLPGQGDNNTLHTSFVRISGSVSFVAMSAFKSLNGHEGWTVLDWALSRYGPAHEALPGYAPDHVKHWVYGDEVVVVQVHVCGFASEDSCAHVFSAVRLVLQHDWIMIMILRAFIGSSRIFVLVYVVFIGESCCT